MTQTLSAPSWAPAAWLQTLPAGVPVVEWAAFLSGGQAIARTLDGAWQVQTWPGFVWNQDEHVTLIGPTGVGKSTLVREILPYRKFVWIAAAKPVDETIDRYVREDGFKIAADPKVLPRPKVSGGFLGARTVEPVKLIVRPRFIDTPTLTYEQHQAQVFTPLLRASFAQGGWCHVADDLDYMCNQLGLTVFYERLYALGRAGKSIVVSNLQRPRNVPLLAYSSATHLFIYCTNDDDDLKRLEGLGGLPTKLIRAIVASLPHHVVLYVNTRDRSMAVTKVGR